MAETFELKCGSCDHLFDADDAGGPVYECGRCGTSFAREDSADGDSSRCPNCNIFSAKVADLACPECFDYEGLEEGVFEPPPPPTEEELAEREARRAASRVEMEKHLAESRARHEEIAVRWRELAPAFAVIRADLPAEILETFGDPEMQGSHHMLDARDGEAIARLLLGLPPAPPTRDHYEDRAELRDRWVADELWRAFEGLEAPESLWRFFGDGVRTGVREVDLAAVARRLNERKAAD